EPAQVVQCPCCQAMLAVPEDGIRTGEHTLHFVYKGGRAVLPPLDLLVTHAPLPSVNLISANISPHSSTGYKTLSIAFSVPQRVRLTADNVDEWWEQVIKPVLGPDVVLQSARPARPGYFILRYPTNRNSS